jgi:GNAT superfamily N-acetyltransferase
MELRPLSIDDTEAVVAVVNRFERHWDLPLATPAAQVHDDLIAPSIDLDGDTRGCWAGASLVGWGIVWHRPSGERLERAYLQGMVDPDHAGQGVGRRLLAWQIERARLRLAERDPSLPWHIMTNEWDVVTPSHRLYRRFGLLPARYNKEMIRSLDAPAVVEPPPGVTTTTWDRRLDERARLVRNEAFSHHWGSVPMDGEAFKHEMEANGSRLDLSFLAIGAGDVVGFCLNAVFPEDEGVTGRREGWVSSLGVRDGWGGKGIASSLLASSFNAFRAAGMTHSMIGVDSENPSGAFRLYQKMGYEMLYGNTSFQLTMTPDPIQATTTDMLG